MKRILYISGSVGLGHVVRDLAIAKEMRKRDPNLEIHWLAAHPATVVLAEAGQTILPQAERFAAYTAVAEKIAEPGFRMNVLKYAFRFIGLLINNARLFKQVVAQEQFDLVVGDEAFEAWLALMNGIVRLDVPFVMMFDLFGGDSLTSKPIERLLNYLTNVTWYRGSRFLSRPPNIGLFFGQAEDIADKPLGLLLPNRRKLAEKSCRFVGHVVPFDPADYADRSAVRKKLGYGQEPLIVCSIGGTAVGGDLLKLCCQAYPIIRKQIPGVQMLLVCGPRLDKNSLTVPDGVTVKGYVPALYEHFAASDLAIVQAGGTTTLELTALKRPFLYFPLEGHFEQQIQVSGLLARHKAGIKMRYKETTPDSLAKMVISNIGTEVDYLPMPVDGARKAAEIIAEMLESV
jgi:UDP-N-acetylglucosamine:LPS N-acetylglucosamine transferase